MKIFNILLSVAILFFTSCEKETDLFDFNDCDTAYLNLEVQESDTVHGGSVSLKADHTHRNCDQPISEAIIQYFDEDGALLDETVFSSGTFKVQGSVTEQVTWPAETYKLIISYTNRVGELVKKPYYLQHNVGSSTGTDSGSTTGNTTTWNSSGYYNLNRVSGNACGQIRIFFPTTPLPDGTFKVETIQPKVILANSNNCGLFVNDVVVKAYNNKSNLNPDRVVSGSTHQWGGFDLNAGQSSWQGGVQYKIKAGSKAIMLYVRSGNSEYQYIIR